MLVRSRSTFYTVDPSEVSSFGFSGVSDAHFRSAAFDSDYKPFYERSLQVKIGEMELSTTISIGETLPKGDFTERLMESLMCVDFDVFKSTLSNMRLYVHDNESLESLHSLIHAHLNLTTLKEFSEIL